MDANLSNPDDLNELERRLASWAPTPEGLNTDAMLFAAGRASARSSGARLVWPVVSGGLALVVVFLGIRLSAERAERLAMLQELDFRLANTPLAPDDATPTHSYAPVATSAYIVLLREWEQRPVEWSMNSRVQGEEPPGPTIPEVNILRAWQPHGPREPL
jgi:hypothetical protein